METQLELFDEYTDHHIIDDAYCSCGWKASEHNLANPQKRLASIMAHFITTNHITSLPRKTEGACCVCRRIAEGNILYDFTSPDLGLVLKFSNYRIYCVKCIYAMGLPYPKTIHRAL